jgi:hypothetical protein
VAVEIRVTGAEQMRALALDLKAAGSDGAGLRRELLAGMRAVGKPLADKARASALSLLPKAGGLNQWVADSNIGVRNNLTGSSTRIGMRIVSTKGAHNLEGIDAGRVRHPVYGKRSTWVSQTVPQGWFSTPLAESAPEVQATLILAMDLIGRRIERG